MGYLFFGNIFCFIYIFTYNFFFFFINYEFFFIFINLCLDILVSCSSPNGDENFVENKALFDYSKISDGAEAAKPSSMTVSEFHFLLLIGNKVKVGCRQHSSYGSASDNVHFPNC